MKTLVALAAFVTFASAFNSFRRPVFNPPVPAPLPSKFNFFNPPAPAPFPSKPTFSFNPPAPKFPVTRKLPLCTSQGPVTDREGEDERDGYPEDDVGGGR